MKIFKALSGILAFLIAGLFIVSNFSSTERRFECVGTISSDENMSDEKLFFRWEKYRWWVGLWSDSEGNFWLEIPNKTVAYYEMIEESRDRVTVHTNGKMAGLFSTLSSSIDIDIPVYGPFSGTCKEIIQ